MTKKDYELIAACIHEQITYEREHTINIQAGERVVWALANKLAMSLREDNPQFNITKFFRACGV